MDALRRLPKVDVLAQSEQLTAYPPKVRVEAARAALATLREEIQAGGERALMDPEQLAAQFAEEMAEPSLKPAINLSGVLLHTGLGRARLAPSAVAQIAKIANSHANVELDLESGRRGDRQSHVRELLCELTGAEDAYVVNNAAAGVLLTLSALCANQEVLLSRGQMVEIGGSFRMPDVVRQSGCRLVEVGCTNKTRISDYEAAWSFDCAAVLRCHPSNFKIVGFTEEPSISELASFAQHHGILLVDDQGSGCLIDLSQFGLSSQPTLPGSIAGGADIAIASGDKLLGGPQAGIIVGRKDLIDTVRKHPLARCARIDKLTLAALEATLRLYAERREDEIPTIQYLKRKPEEILKMAKSLAKAYPGGFVQPGLSEVGGGSCPGEGLPTFRVGLPSDDAEGLLAALRRGDPPIIGRIEDGTVWLDPRTLDESELKKAAGALKSL